MKRRKKGLLLHPDDMQIGRLCTVHYGWPFLDGQAHRITAINLPFVVLAPYAGRNSSVTIDVRITTLMAVTQDFADAQVDCRPSQN